MLMLSCEMRRMEELEHIEKMFKKLVNDLYDMGFDFSELTYETTKLIQEWWDEQTESKRRAALAKLTEEEKKLLKLI